MHYALATAQDFWVGFINMFIKHIPSTSLVYHKCCCVNSSHPRITLNMCTRAEPQTGYKYVREQTVRDLKNKQLSLWRLRECLEHYWQIVTLSVWPNGPHHDSTTHTTPAAATTATKQSQTHNQHSCKSTFSATKEPPSSECRHGIVQPLALTKLNTYWAQSVPFTHTLSLKHAFKASDQKDCYRKCSGMLRPYIYCK